jgi:hypothetical protein
MDVFIIHWVWDNGMWLSEEVFFFKPQRHSSLSRALFSLFPSQQNTHFTVDYLFRTTGAAKLNREAGVRPTRPQAL